VANEQQAKCGACKGSGVGTIEWRQIGIDDAGNAVGITTCHYDCKACGGTGNAGTAPATPSEMTNTDTHPLNFHCPHCAAPAGAPCITPSGRATVYHSRRYGQHPDARDREDRLARVIRAFWRPDEVR